MRKLCGNALLKACTACVSFVRYIFVIYISTIASTFVNHPPNKERVAHAPPPGYFSRLENRRAEDDLYLRKRVRMRRWLCCTCQVEESYPSHETEHLKHPASHADGYQKGSRVSDPIRAEADKAVPTIEVPALSLDELKQETDNFGSKALIGEGSYGRVYYANLSNGKAVAVKKLDVSSEPETNVDFLNQVARVSRLKHDNLVELLGYCVEGNIRVLAYEFATMGSLHDILHGRKGVQGAQPGPTLEWVQRVRIAVDAARGLEYLHEKVQPSVIHRDIRSSNVLLFEDYKAKIADFNLSNQAPDMAARLHSTRVLGTFGYHAPEYGLLPFSSLTKLLFSSICTLFLLKCFIHGCVFLVLF
ncbi:hypothetical protein KY290_012027 [Solanum tuberosum]|uniref:Protein kinase domain-containing protein n=1 Tax=Solanum tuberosum TaxID=4113 RepID=A0ABQ7W2R4_SOLTU|nr:hypothetical protein KY290_012027 [Solanum tuberosum]